MSPQLIKSLYVLISFKRELQIVLFVFLTVLFLPLLVVVILTSTGSNVISDRLVGINQTTNRLEIYDPVTGNVTNNLQTKTVWPIKGKVTLEFGESDLPYQVLHTGIDIAGNTGTPITPVMSGRVIYAGSIPLGYGNHIIIDHGNNLTSLYAHLQKIAVKVGNHVEPGDTLGYVGQSGWATGPHLHFELRVSGIPVNPRTFVETSS